MTTKKTRQLRRNKKLMMPLVPKRLTSLIKRRPRRSQRKKRHVRMLPRLKMHLPLKLPRTSRPTRKSRMWLTVWVLRMASELKCLKIAKIESQGPLLLDSIKLQGCLSNQI